MEKLIELFQAGTAVKEFKVQGLAFKMRTLTTDELIEKINKVTKNEIITAANMITLDTVYVLKGVSKN